jgi:hypothetical protein
MEHTMTLRQTAILPALALLGCATSDLTATADGEAIGRSAKVDVCHWSEDDSQYVEINVSSNSAHFDASKHPDDVLPGSWYPDADLDGQGDASATASSCPGDVEGWTTDNSDCDDSSATTYDGAEELCDDAVDNDCDGDIDEDCATYPEACDTGTDPHFGSPWVVCDADEDSAWISADNVGQFHAEVVCQDLGYDTVSSWSGTCGNVCGYCEAPTSCENPGNRNPENRSWASPNGGYTSLGGWIHRTVQWECANY